MKSIIRIYTILLLVIGFTNVRGQFDIPEPPPTHILSGHTAFIRSVIELSNGRLLSTSNDDTLRLWDADGTLVRVLEGHTDNVANALQLPDTRIVSWSDDGVLRFWDEDGEALLVIQMAHSARIEGVRLLADGRLLSWGDNRARFWDLDGTLLQEIINPDDAIANVFILSDERIITIGWTPRIYMWSADGTRIAQMDDDLFDTPMGMLELEAGRILTWGFDTFMTLWDADGTRITRFEGDGTLGLQSAPTRLLDGHIISYGTMGKLYVWDVEGNLLSTIGNHSGGVYGVLQLPDERIISWSDDATIRIRHLETGAFQALDGHTDTVLGMQLLPDERLLSWSSDKTLCVWDVHGNLIARLVGIQDMPMRYPLVLSDGRIVVINNTADFSIWIWEAA